jgi:hypothetical protein
MGAKTFSLPLKCGGMVDYRMFPDFWQVLEMFKKLKKR